MTAITDNITIIDVTAENVADVGIFCIKDKKSAGYFSKLAWFVAKINKGLKIKIASDKTGKQVGFIEYIPSELAWRPVKADNFVFIQCIGIFAKDAREKGIGSYLIQQCELEAKRNGKSGICGMTSDGPWMANKLLFEKNDFSVAEKLGRFELMFKKFDTEAITPAFFDWTTEQAQYQGWHLVYADQCPWHEKSVTDIRKCAADHLIELKITRLENPAQAQRAPSGFGTFSLLKDGKLLADHYISKTRFENIVREERKRG